MLRAFFSTLMMLGIAIVATTIPVGEKTTWQHLSAIWQTPEAQTFRQDAAKTAAPMMEKVKRGVAAGIKAAIDEETPTPASPATEVEAPAPTLPVQVAPGTQPKVVPGKPTAMSEKQATPKSKRVHLPAASS